MVMALQFLKAQPTQDAKTQKMILEIEGKLKAGYDKLVSFKTKEKGYEWFGESPAHEALSAYGLMQFKEMSKVTQFVDQGMVNDLQKFLMSRRDGKGEFLMNPKALDSFGRAPSNITAAYIVWTLSSAGETNLNTEIDALKAMADAQIAAGQVDAYFNGLLAACLYNLGRNTEAQVYADAIIPNQLSTGNVTQSLTTITTSMGANLVIETTAISTIAWLFDQQRYGDEIVPAVNWLVSKVKAGGSYGSTQATILSLKAITSYMQNFASINGQGQFVLRLNSKVAQTIAFTSDKKDAIMFDFASLAAPGSKFAPLFAPGQAMNVSIALENFVANQGETMDFKVNYAFAFNYYDTTPEAVSSILSYQVKQAFDASALGAAKSSGKVFSYKVSLRNLKTFTPVPMVKAANGTMIPGIIMDGGLGMVLGIVRVPACLEIDFNYLEGLKRNRLVDFYEVRNYNSEIVFYWRQMMGGETKTLQVNFVQRYSGACLQKPHTAYPYYNNDQPVWVLSTM